MTRTDVEKRILTQIESCGLTVIQRSHDEIEVSLGEHRQKVYLDNIIRDVLRDQDIGRVRFFVEQVVSSLGLSLPDRWEDAQDHVYLVAESSEFKVESCISEELTPGLRWVLGYCDAEEKFVSFLSVSDLKSWHTSRQDAVIAAKQNLSRLLGKAKAEVNVVAGVPMVSFDTPSIMKASFIFSPALPAIVMPTLGWPVLAVAPCRDFLLIFPESGEDALVPRLGTVVLREFSSSGYPITTEVLHVSDEGITALGRYGG